MSDEEIRKILLLVYAKAIKQECIKHEVCEGCPIFGRYETEYLPNPTCPFYNANNPSEWLVD